MTAKAAISALFLATVLRGQVPVCDLFRDLKAADGRELIVTGELIISKNLAVLGTADCDNRFKESHQLYPSALGLRPSANLPPNQLQQLTNAATEADRLRAAGKQVDASASLTGRVKVGIVGGLPAELTFSSVEDLKVEAGPDPDTLPVIPICELFQNLLEWKGRRIAVRGESVGTSEGFWISAHCKGGFYTTGYRWPVALTVGTPADYSSETAPFLETKQPKSAPKGETIFRGRNTRVEKATFIGRLRVRDQYLAHCRPGGDYLTNGFGHLNYAAAEILLEEVRDVEWTTPAAEEDSDGTEDALACQPSNIADLCAAASTLVRAAALGCVDRAREILAKDGIDSQNGSESPALGSAIDVGNEALVKLLIEKGAPVNPSTVRLWPPLWEAAHRGRARIVELLLQSGAKVDGVDHRGATFLASYGVFDTRIMKILLNAGANPNATEEDGQTALMGAAGYGYEEAIQLLIAHQAQVNLKDLRGRTALMHAAAGRYVDAIPLLLEAGADLYARDAQGDTALDIARKSKNSVAVELLSGALKGAH
jgi:hypothetical protein